MSGYPNMNERVKGLIDATEANILRIESQILDLTLALQKERKTLAQLWLMATPMGKLPTELLVEIFTRAVEDEALSQSIQFDDVLLDLISGKAPFSPTLQLRVLSQVCPYWRRIVNSTPKLWAVGMVDVQLDKKSCSTEAYISGLKTLLERSAPLPISVSLTQMGDSGTSTGATAQAATTSAVIRAMAPTIRRWKSLQVDCLSFKPLTALPGGAFPALESLNIEYETYGQIDPVRAFFPAPRLRHLALRLHGPGEAHAQLIPMPWAQLTHIKLEHYSLAGCRGILMQCANIVSAHLETSEWNAAHAVDGPVTVLPFLKELRVRFDMGADEIGRVEPFFEPLSLPALHTLHLTFDPSPAVLWPSNFSAFQSRSPHITHLTLANCPLHFADLIALLRAAPAITTLKLKRFLSECIDDGVLRLLTYDASDAAAPLAPQLRQIHWEGLGQRFSELVLEAAIRSRWWMDARESTLVAKLEKVSLSYYDGSMSGDLIHRMRDVVEQGLDLNLESSEYS
ncbi:hypothetical protein DFH09DRAFT_212576 [Mycena vulgaris]|nr:hypothetical protein DFH09DRAFT_212576 [Mycena vulgaris]